MRSRGLIGAPAVAVAIASAAFLLGCEQKRAPALPPARSAAPAPSAPAASALPRTLSAPPPAFLGEFNAKLSDCGSDHGDGRLVITADRVSFYESAGQLVSVVQTGE